jgi:hypothetical protein
MMSTGHLDRGIEAHALISKWHARVLVLRGKSRRGKTRIKAHGERWMVRLVQADVAFSDDAGPWVMLQPLDSDRTEVARRWVNLRADRDFEIVEVRDAE